MSQLNRLAWAVVQIVGACCVAASVLLAAPPTATWAAEPVDIDSNRELFVDDHLIDVIEGDARLELQCPMPREVALVTDAPWEGNICAYYTVFRDTDSAGQEFCRMYYRGANYDLEARDQTHRRVTCYAESKDGIHWTKPNLGLYEFEGSKANNIVWDGAGTGSFTPFKDTSPDCPPEARYKALGQVHKTGTPHLAVQEEMTVFAYKSPDGIHWTISDGPLITKGDFDSQNTAFWDPHAGLYREYHRVRFYEDPGGELILGGIRARPGFRSIMTGTSSDFLNWVTWTEPELLEFDDDIGPQHLYTNAVMSYPRAPQILVGFPTRLLPEEGNRVEPILMTSRDGRTFRRWAEPVIPESAPEDRAGNRSNYMAWGLVPTPGNDREYSVYASENYLSSTPTRLRRFTYRIDGFVALRGGEKGGQLATRPLSVGGGQLEINYLARPGGHVRVEIQDAAGKPLPGFTAADCDPLEGDEIAKTVTWQSDGHGPFAEGPVRVRFEVKDADLFSFRFGSCVGAVSAVGASEPADPEVRVTNVRRVFHNGEHNAFTDLIRFRDRYYLAFRSCPDGHMVHPTSSNIILESEDARTWRQVHRFSVPKRDTRDPHFLIFKDKLFVYTGTWYCGDSSPKDFGFNEHLGYASWTTDGRKWSEPVMLEGTYGHYIWRAAAHNGTAYLCGRRKREFAETSRNIRSDCESAMLESDDGLIWRTRALFQTTHGNETAFLFEPDGSVLAVARFTLDNSQLCRSKPPYTEWDRTDLGRFIGGPLLARWGGRCLVGGRKTTGERPETALYWLIDGELHECAVLPSDGDNSYPGFVELSPTRGLLSWYSSHEKDASGKPMTAIYLADLEVAE